MQYEALKREPKKIKVRRLDGKREASDPRPEGKEPVAGIQQGAAEDEASWRDRYLRLAADLENTKKRLAKNADRRVREEKGELILDLLPLADNLERILAHASSGAGQDLEHGLRVTLNDFLARLKKQGVEPVEALGQPFDPGLHEAVGKVSQPGADPGEVVRVEQRGYLLDGWLIRPARVLIAE